MSKVSLSVNEVDIFGKFMPSVNIERVEISNMSPDEDDGWEYGEATSVKFTYSLYMTYPNELTEDQAHWWVHDKLGDLRVFVCFNPYPGMNKVLRRNRLMLHDLFKNDRYAAEMSGISYYNLLGLQNYEATKLNPGEQLTPEETPSDYNAVTAKDEYVWYTPVSWWRTWRFLNQEWRPLITSAKIKNLISEDYTKTTMEFIYDDKGNRTLKIGDFHRYEHQWDWLLNKYSDYAVMAFCGSYEPVTVDADSATKIMQNESATAFQRRFGDISYVDVLKYNVVPYTTNRGFIYATTEQAYPGIPIQALDATYRDSTEVTHEQLQQKFAGMLSNFENFLSKSPTLRENYNTIAAMLSTEFMDPEILRNLNRYRKTFTSKDPTTLSGRLYLAFQSLISSFNSLLLSQEEIKTIYYLNTRVIDTRREDYGVSYIAPTPAGGDALSTVGDDFIPSKWVSYARMTRDTVPTHGALADFAEFCLEEGFGSPFVSVGVRESGAIDDTGGDYLITEPGGIYSMTAEEAEVLASVVGLDFSAAREIYNESYDEEGVWSHGSWGRAVQDRNNRDIVVRNKGIIHFDWEKACWTKSQLSHVLNLRRLKRYLGIEIPYAYYPVLRTTLTRTEQLLVTQLEDVTTAGSSSYFHAEDTYLAQDHAHVSEDYGYGGTRSLITRGFDNTNGVTVTIENVMKEQFNNTPGVLSTTSYAAPETLYNMHRVKPPIDFEVVDEGYSDTYVQPQNWKKYGYPWVGTETLVPNMTESSKSEDFSDSGSTIVADYIVDAMMMNFSSLGGGSRFNNLIQRLRNASGGEYAAVEWNVMARYLLGGGMSGEESEEFENTLAGLDFEAFVGTPTIDQLSDLSYSYVKFVNFDVMNPDPESTLENFALTDRFQDGYRLMTFEFQDYMDDDVAFRNTIGFEDNTAVGWGLEGTPSTYQFSVEVLDRTLLLYDQVYRKLRAEYDNFMRYYDFCHDKCSYNQKNLAFEEWFKDAATEEYPEEKNQPWVRAPIAFNTLRMILFGERAFDSSFTSDTSAAEEAMRLSSLMWISKISPYSGSLIYLDHFRYWFANTLNILYPQADLPQTVEAMFTEEYDEMREIMESVDLTRPDGEARVIYDDSTGAPVLYGPGSSRASGFNAAYERMLNVALLYDPNDPGSVAGTTTGYTFPGTGESSYLGSTRGDGGSDDHGGLYFSAINNFKKYEFSNSWEIDKQIFGDVKLSKLRHDDYDPYESGAAASSVAAAVSALDIYEEGIEAPSQGIKLCFARDNPEKYDTDILSDLAHLTWDMQRVRVLYNADDWTKDEDVALESGPGSVGYGYFRQAGEQIGIIQGWDAKNGIWIPYEYFESKGYLSDGNGITWDQDWALIGYDYGGSEGVEALHYRGVTYTKTYKECHIQIVYEVWNAAVNRWVGVKYATVPIPMYGSATGRYNWWAARRTIMDMADEGRTSSEYSNKSWLGQGSLGADSSAKFVQQVSNLNAGEISTSMVARAFLKSRSSYLSGMDPISVLQDYRRGNYYDLARSEYTPGLATLESTMTTPSDYYGVTHDSYKGDYAFEAWRKGGNIIYFNLQPFQKLVGSPFQSTGYDYRRSVPYQFNELLHAISGRLSLSGAGYTATSLKATWRFAFDYVESYRSDGSYEGD